MESGENTPSNYKRKQKFRISQNILQPHIVHVIEDLNKVRLRPRNNSKIRSSTLIEKNEWHLDSEFPSKIYKPARGYVLFQEPISELEVCRVTTLEERTLTLEERCSLFWSTLDNFNKDKINPKELRSQKICRRIIQDHHNNMKDDPNRLTTEFLIELTGCKCNRIKNNSDRQNEILPSRESD